MKQLFESIKTQFVFELLEKIDCEIITESIKANIIKELAKQLLDQIQEEKKQNENYSYRSIYNENFKQIFGQSRIAWDKLDDKDIETIEAQTWDEKKLKNTNEKLIRSIIKGDKSGIIISRNPETKKFEYVVLSCGNVYYLLPSYGKHAGSRTGWGGGRSYKDLTQREKIDLFSNKTLYYIDTTQFINDNDKLRQERYLSKQGMIYLDPSSLRRMAEDNRDRYKKILAQNKARNTNNDQVLEQAQNLINEVAEITIKVAKDPLSYSDVLYKIGELSKWIYDKRVYNSPRSARQQGYYSGKNGLLPMIATYIEAIKDSKNGYSWGSDRIDSSIKTIKDSIANCQKLLDEIKELL